ncbi:hypothetical protein [Limnobaculum parvum]|uniref:hypothetical protein n=1 Tax=Limnobaculum parvum TaxID=2172103 RepID=UPI0018641A64|nr:hypothetical protein [Limnobaculum parvum]
MNELIQQESLTPEEIAVQCLAVINAALNTENLATREALMFVLQERLRALYKVLGE